MAIPHKTVVGAGDDKPKFPQKPQQGKDLFEVMLDSDIRNGNLVLGTSFKNPEDFLPRIQELLLDGDMNTRVVGAYLLKDAVRANPAALGPHIKRLIPLLKLDNSHRTGDPYCAVATAVRDVAAYNVKLLPSPKETIGALLFTWDRTLEFTVRARLAENEKTIVEGIEKARPRLLADFMEYLCFGSRGELDYRRVGGFNAFIGMKGGQAGLAEEDVALLAGLGQETFNKLFKSYYELRKAAHSPSGADMGPMKEARYAVIDGTIRLFAAEKMKRQALKSLCDLVEVRSTILGDRLHEIVRNAESSRDSNYLLICKIARTALEGGAAIPSDDAEYFLKGIDERGAKAQKEGKEIANLIQPQK